MISAELTELLTTMRLYGTDLRHVEAKRSRSDLPKGLWQTLSAFSNSPEGGVVLLGIDETSGFEVTGVDDPRKILQDFGSLCAEMEPPLRLTIEPQQLEGKTVIVAHVPELTPSQKPCYYRSRGLAGGTYVRVSDGDRTATTYEIQQMMASREARFHDALPVPGATVEDLDAEALAHFLERLRVVRSRFRDDSDKNVMRYAKVLVPHEGVETPSLAALLALGKAPQNFVENLAVTFVVHPGLREGDLGPLGERMLDNQFVDGPIWTMVTRTIQAIDRNTGRAAIVQGTGRADRTEFPHEALRESLVNALAHRDLSEYARATPVQVKLFPDRLVVSNLGGLHGVASLDDLGRKGFSVPRNPTLMQILESSIVPGTEHAIAEQRGSGITAMARALRISRLAPPRFESELASFSVTFPRVRLDDNPARDWVESVNDGSLSEEQRLALVLMYQGDTLTPQRYRLLHREEDRSNTRELEDMVRRGLAVSVGSVYWPRYRLSPSYQDGTGRPISLPKIEIATPPKRARKRIPRAERIAQIRAMLMAEGALSRANIQQRLGISSHSTVLDWLQEMIDAGDLDVVKGGPTDPGTTYRIADGATDRPGDEHL